MLRSMLTTVDNPFDPFDEFDSWYAWDFQSGYHSLDLLGRIANDSFETSEADRVIAIENAIDEIVSENVNGVYRKVQKEVESKTVKGNP